MLLTATIGLALVLSLVLPIYPEGLEPSVLAFLGLAGATGVFALTHRVARRELLVMSVWVIVVAVAMFVGSVRHADAQQILEDTLPYALFVLGLLAGRASRHPRQVILLVMLVCFVDSLVSLINVLPHYTPGFRSSYTYKRIVAGMPLLGMFALSFLRRLDRESLPGRARRRVPVAMALHAVMLVAMVASVSRGMMLAWIAGTAIVAYLRSPSRGLLAIIGITLAFIAYSSIFADIGVRYLRAGEGGTIAGRFDEIRTALEVFTQYPLFGSGLGSAVEVDGRYHTYVHNLIAYHLWKFGLLGSTMLAIPLLVVGAQVRRYPRQLRAAAVGGATAIFAYLVTCAVYKTYYLVWTYGVTAGAVLSVLWQWQRERAALAESPDRAAVS